MERWLVRNSPEGQDGGMGISESDVVLDCFGRNYACGHGRKRWREETEMVGVVRNPAHLAQVEQLESRGVGERDSTWRKWWGFLEDTKAMRGSGSILY